MFAIRFLLVICLAVAVSAQPGKTRGSNGGEQNPLTKGRGRSNGRGRGAPQRGTEIG